MLEREGAGEIDILLTHFHRDHIEGPPFFAPLHRRDVRWGHSTMSQAGMLAVHAGVRRLCLFHHAPEREDDELLARVESMQQGSNGLGRVLGIELAAEARTLVLRTGES